MAYIGNIPALQYITHAKQTLTADSSTVAFTLSQPVANENELEVFVNNVRQEPGSGKAYTASGTTLTMSAAPTTGDSFYCIYQGKATQTVTPGASTVTNDMLSGSIANAKLANSSITLNSSAVSLGGSHSIDNTPAFFVSKTDGAQTLSDSSATKITFNTELYDTDSAFASDKFTVPSGKAGKYFFSTGVNTYDAQGSIKRHIVYFYKNGSQASMANNDLNNNDNYQLFNFHSVVFDLSAGDYIEVYSLNDTADGGDSVVASASSKFETWFSGYKLII